MPYGNNVQYFQSEDGKDFYESLPLFTKKYKLCITPDSGVICSISQDASALYPAGFSVVETDELPEGTDISGNWKFDNGVISQLPVNYTKKRKHCASHILIRHMKKLMTGERSYNWTPSAMKTEQHLPNGWHTSVR